MAMECTITLELAGDSAAADDFRQAVTAFDDLLKAMTRSACGDEAAVQWTVRVQAGSILLGVDPAGGADAGPVVAALARTLWGKPDAVLACAAVGPLRVLAGAPGTHLWVGQERTPVTDELPAGLRSLLRKPYRQKGTVEGKLTMLSERSGLAIHEPGQGRRIRCSVPEERLEEMRVLWRRRVTAVGMVQYGADGYPIQIEAEHVEPFPDDAELPSHMDVVGVLRAD